MKHTLLIALAILFGCGRQPQKDKALEAAKAALMDELISRTAAPDSEGEALVSVKYGVTLQTVRRLREELGDRMEIVMQALEATNQSQIVSLRAKIEDSNIVTRLNAVARETGILPARAAEIIIDLRQLQIHSTRGAE